MKKPAFIISAAIIAILLTATACDNTGVVTETTPEETQASTTVPKTTQASTAAPETTEISVGTTPTPFPVTTTPAIATPTPAIVTPTPVTVVPTEVVNTEIPTETPEDKEVKVTPQKDSCVVDISIPEDGGKSVSVVAVKKGAKDWMNNPSDVFAMDQLKLDSNGNGSITFKLDFTESYTVIVTAPGGTYKTEVTLK